MIFDRQDFNQYINLRSLVHEYCYCLDYGQSQLIILKIAKLTNCIEILEPFDDKQRMLVLSWLNSNFPETYLGCSF